MSVSPATTLIKVAAKLSDINNSNKFYYFDDQKETQGPFSRQQMAAWTTQNCFDPSLLIRCGETGSFTRLDELSGAGEALQDFFSTSARDDVLLALRALGALRDEEGTSRLKKHTRKSTWEKKFDSSSEHDYYYDTATGQSQWECPSDF